MPKIKCDSAKKLHYTKWSTRMFILLLSVFTFAGCSDSYTVYGRYVNYDCSPVVGEKMVMMGVTHEMYGYGSNSDEDTTDSEGNFSGRISGHKKLMILPSREISKRPMDRKDALTFSSEELPELRSEISRKMPVIVYKEKGFARKDLNRGWEKRVFSYALPRDSEKSIPYWYTFGLKNTYGRYADSYLKVNLKRIEQKKEPSWEMIFSSVDGGLIEVPLNKLPFSEKLPVKGYNQSVVFKFNQKDTGDNVIKKAFYLKAMNGRVYATVIVNMKITTSDLAMANGFVKGLNHSIYYIVGNIFVNMLYTKGYQHPVKTPYLMKKKCGGLMPKAHSSYYDLLPLLNVKPDKYGTWTMNRLKSKDDAYDLIKKAKRPETTVEWLLKPEHLHNRWVALGMLQRTQLDDRVANAMLDYYSSKENPILIDMTDANGLSANLYRKLYNQIIDKKNQRHYPSFMMVFSRNTKLPQDVFYKMIKRAMSKDTQNANLRPIAKNQGLSEKNVDMLLNSPDKEVLYLAAIHKNASIKLLTILSENSSNIIKREISWNPRTPPDVLRRMSKVVIAYINNTIKSKRSKSIIYILDNIATNPNTPVSVLLDIAKLDDDGLSYYLLSCNPNTPTATRISLTHEYSRYRIKTEEKCWEQKRSSNWKH